MTDHSNDNENPAEQDSPNFRRLREKVEKLEQENARLRTDAAANMVRVAGFDPDHKLTSLVLERYLAGEDAELTPDAFTMFAKDFDLPSTREGDGGDKPDSRGEGDRNAAQYDELQAGADELRQGSQQPAPQASIDDAIAQAESEGAWDQARALKTEKIRRSLLASATPAQE